MGRRAARRARRDRGAVAVEFALLFPVLLLLIFGMIDFGRAINAQITLTQAARTGARLAAIGNQTIITDTMNAATGLSNVAPAFQECPIGVSFGGSGCTPSPAGTTDGSTDTCQPGDASNMNAIVKASYNFKFVTPLSALAGLFGASTIGSGLTLTATGVMPCET